MTWMSQTPETITLRPQRSLGGIIFEVTLEESHEDSLQITEHPVEQGASVSDHAFCKPAALTLRAATSGAGSAASGVASPEELYEKLLALQRGREPFEIITGKRKYANMLLESLSVVTDEGTEHVLSVSAQCREVIIVNTVAVSVPASRTRHANPKKTAATTDKGTKQTRPKSAIKELFG